MAIEISDNEDEVIPFSTGSKRHTPAQNELKEKIYQLRTKLDLEERRKNSLIADGTKKQKILQMQHDIDECDKMLKK